MELLNHKLLNLKQRLLTVRNESNAFKDDDFISLRPVMMDTTKSHETEIDIVQKTELLQLVQELEYIGFWRISLASGKLIWSDSLAKIYDFEVGAHMTLEILFSQMHPEDVEYVQNLKAIYIKTKKFKKFRHRTVRKNGEIRTVEVVGKVICNEVGEAIEFIGSSRDITEQLCVQQQILETNKNLEKSTIELTARNNQLADFNHITSHNLRAPVSNLNALLDLWKGANASLREELFDKFEIVINHLTLTLNSLIESLKITNNKEFTREKLSFEETLNKTKEVLSAQIITTKAIIRSDFSEIEHISYNQIYLESIFQNLMSNSIKYKSPYRIPEIEIKSSLVDDKINLSFKDNGLGIDLNKHGSKLFGLNKVFHKHPQANGMGLFITKTQIEAAGGSIYAESEVNSGTTFFITFN